jgi:hypothetical protein
MSVRDHIVPEHILPPEEAARSLPETSRRFEERGADAEPVFFGSPTAPSGVMLSYQRYVNLLDRIDDLAIALEVSQRDADDGTRLSLDGVVDSLGLRRSDIGFEEGGGA